MVLRQEEVQARLFKPIQMSDVATARVALLVVLLRRNERVELFVQLSVATWKTRPPNNCAYSSNHVMKLSTLWGSRNIPD